MLIDRHGRRHETWTHAEDGAVAGLGDVIVPLASLSDALAKRAEGQRLGVLLPNTARAADIAGAFDALQLVAVRFPAFNDGRGFSVGRLVRAAGFTGTLRAVGPLIADQFAYALACGFDEIELPEASAARQPATQWLAAARSISGGYQRGYARASILDQRRAAKVAGGRR